MYGHVFTRPILSWNLASNKIEYADSSSWPRHTATGDGADACSNFVRLARFLWERPRIQPRRRSIVSRSVECAPLATFQRLATISYSREPIATQHGRKTQRAIITFSPRWWMRSLSKGAIHRSTLTPTAVFAESSIACLGRAAIDIVLGRWCATDLEPRSNTTRTKSTWLSVKLTGDKCSHQMSCSFVPRSPAGMHVSPFFEMQSRFIKTPDIARWISIWNVIFNIVSFYVSLLCVKTFSSDQSQSLISFKRTMFRKWITEIRRIEAIVNVRVKETYK